MKWILWLLLLGTDGDKKTPYSEEIAQHRQHYKEEFVTEKNSPLKAADTAYLRFYEPDEMYRVEAEVVVSEGARSFKIATSNPKVQKEYKEYAVLKFKMRGKKMALHAYRSVKWETSEQYKNLLFVPFTDNTNGKETYGGGRYIDLDIEHIREGKITLDFNKCYNPYCAFATGYSCPVPPKENALDISIKAGEKSFGKEH